METVESKTPDWPEIDQLMSNFDGVVDEAVAERLRTERVIARYPGWNFNAYCWFADGVFHAEAWVYHVPVAVFSAPTPDELREAVCEVYGYE